MVLGPIQWALSIACLLAIIASCIIAFIVSEIGITDSRNMTSTTTTTITTIKATQPTTEAATALVPNITRTRRPRTTTTKAASVEKRFHLPQLNHYIIKNANASEPPDSGVNSGISVNDSLLIANRNLLPDTTLMSLTCTIPTSTIASIKASSGSTTNTTDTAGPTAVA